MPWHQTVLDHKQTYWWPQNLTYFLLVFFGNSRFRIHFHWLVERIKMIDYTWFETRGNGCWIVHMALKYVKHLSNTAEFNYKTYEHRYHAFGKTSEGDTEIYLIYLCRQLTGGLIAYLTWYRIVCAHWCSLCILITVRHGGMPREYYNIRFILKSWPLTAGTLSDLENVFFISICVFHCLIALIHTLMMFVYLIIN